MMLTEICQEIRNWFDRGLSKWYGAVMIRDGQIMSPVVDLKDGQYYRIVGSVFNDGVHAFPYDETLVDEDFTGSLWAMAVPPSVIALGDEIEKWQGKYGGADGILASPYQSESFGGYSYSKTGAASGSGGGTTATWKSTFANDLNRWRKI